jgi:hypothetical protein
LRCFPRPCVFWAKTRKIPRQPLQDRAAMTVWLASCLPVEFGHFPLDVALPTHWDGAHHLCSPATQTI